MIIPYSHLLVETTCTLGDCMRLSVVCRKSERRTSHIGCYGEVTSCYTWTLRVIGWRYTTTLLWRKQEDCDQVKVIGWT
jgi:hypothetical protein